MPRLLLLAVILSLPCFASTDCQTTVTTNNAARIAFCITANGNIINLAGPPDTIQIATNEGYGVCSSSGQYFDLAVGDSGNWQASVIDQPHGSNTFPLTITRKTADNLFTLVQIFKLVGAGKAVGVTMKVLGPQAGIVRYAEVVPQSGRAQLGSHTSSTAFIWSEGQFGFLAKPTIAAQVSANIVGGGVTNPCSPTGSNGNLAALLNWMTIPPKWNVFYFEYTPFR